MNGMTKPKPKELHKRQIKLTGIPRSVMEALDATKLDGGRWAVRPKGQLGTLGLFPHPWEMRVIKTRYAKHAIEQAVNQGGIWK